MKFIHILTREEKRLSSIGTYLTLQRGHQFRGGFKLNPAPQCSRDGAKGPKDDARHGCKKRAGWMCEVVVRALLFRSIKSHLRENLRREKCSITCNCVKGAWGPDAAKSEGDFVMFFP